MSNIAFFHPSKNNNGSACSFSQSKNGDIYASLIKQDTWDADKKIGGFVGSRGNPDKHINIKISAVEVGAILDSIDRLRPFSNVHDSDKTLKSIVFGLWMSKPTVEGEKPVAKGYTFSIGLTDKEDSTKKISFYIGLTFAETRLVREFLIYSLQTFFRLNEENFNKANE